MKKNYKLLLVSFVIILSATAQQKTYPTNLRWNNAKTDFGCKGDGITDDTDSLRAAARTYKDIYFTNIVVYLPKGKYLVSDSIKLLDGYYDANVTFLGEDPDSTFIILKNNAAGFQDVNNPRPMIQTRSGNQAFGMYFQNLIIKTGTGNPGAVGLDYISSNYGTVENVQIISDDKNAYCGLQMERAWPGPGLIKNVTITGFQYGMRVTQCEYSMTFENITLRNQKLCGLYANCNALAIRNLTSNNKIKVIQSEGGRITLLDSKFTGGNGTAYAIYSNNGSIFTRNLTTTGYISAIINNGVPLAGANITEYHSGPDYSQFTNDGKSLGLAISETPVYTNNDLNTWAKANDYGCLPNNPLYGTYDAGPGLQAAFNSGKKVIYFDKMGDNGSAYCIYADVTIPASVEMIIGFHQAKFAFFNNSKLVINAKGNTTLFVDGMAGSNILNNSKRTIVFKGNALGNYTNTSKNRNGKIFIEDAQPAFKPQFPVNMWARHYNPENQPETDTMIFNNGGKFWILGLKTEGRATIANTINGGSTEILGGLIYPASSFSGNTNTAFKINNANFSATVLTRTSYVGNGWYGNTVIETQGAETKTLVTQSVPAFYTFDFYRSKLPLAVTSKAETENAATIKSNAGIKIYPNPLKGNSFTLSAAMLKGEKAMVTITDINGHIVYSANHNLQYNANIKTNLQTPGIYTVTVKTAKTLYHLQLIKE